MATNYSTALNDEFALSHSVIGRRWGWLLTLGIVQVICGALALAIPLAASLAAAIVFGAVLLVAGVFQAAHAFRVRTWKGVVLHALGALLYIAAGVLVLLFPLTGALTLTLVVGALLLADGVVRFALAFRLRPRDGWGWFLASGIASLLVGVLLLVGWPLTGLWAIGVLLGVNLIFSGVGNCALAFAFRTSHARSVDADTVKAAHRPA
jgi:uncharacterized membrane protein HdeD (DUF308 family)